MPRQMEARFEPVESEESGPPEFRRLLKLTLAATGVVFGDLGTNGLYTVKSCFSGRFDIHPSPNTVFGMVSLIFWILTLTVSVKYLVHVLRADNHGEGGAMALIALVRRSRITPRMRWFLVMAGLLGA